MQEEKVLHAIEYFCNSVKIIDFGALFSDGSEEYCSPCEPAVGDDLTIRFRTAKGNVDSVFVTVNDDRLEVKKAMLEDPTGPSSIYKYDDEIFKVMYLDEIKCMKYSFTKEPVEIK